MIIYSHFLPKGLHTMIVFWVALAALLLLATAALITSYVCFFRVFKARGRKKITDIAKFKAPEDIVPPYGEHAALRDRIIAWVTSARALPHTDVEIKSFDGLTLRGQYFELKKGAPIELLMHGYRGSSELDLCAGVERCFKLGHSALIVDHRASGRSEGKVITFGINESRDCVDWTKFIVREIDPDAKILIGGVSMGGATALIAGGSPELPSNVVGVLGDCGYDSARNIIKKVIHKMGLPENLLYPFVRLGGKLFGRFDIDETSPLEALKNCTRPVLLIHGDADDFVPHEMSVANLKACASEHKKLVTMPGTGHGLAYPDYPDQYIDEMARFFDPYIYNK